MGVRIDFRDFEKLKDKLRSLTGEQTRQFTEETAKNLGLLLRRLTVLKTPVGIKPPPPDKNNKAAAARYEEYWGGYQGGELRRRWSLGSPARKGGEVSIDLTNNVKYAPYVEYGHRQTPGRYVPALGKRLKAGWVDGVEMLKKSENELSNAAPGIIQRELDMYIRKTMND